MVVVVVVLLKQVVVFILVVVVIVVVVVVVVVVGYSCGCTCSPVLYFLHYRIFHYFFFTIIVDPSTNDRDDTCFAVGDLFHHLYEDQQ